ncbi:MAG TPA: pyridoxal phosphate-dependent aminotransferase [Candidatus Acidoferrales bacterium]|nr:pyridoxal phosphate-dependent aminotransferase [Candidatus Acidoferrales bacterium]
MFSDRTSWNLKSNRLSEALAKHRAAGKPLLDLTASNPTECGFDYDRQAILQVLSNPKSLSYGPDPKGLLSARRAVSEYYSAREIMVPADDIILTTSTSEAYSFVFRVLCNPGDELLIPEPSYPLFSFLADIQDVKLVGYPLLYDHGWQIDFHALQQAVTARTRGMIVVNPNNPTGHFCKPSEVRKLNEICSRRQIAIIADEVFLDFSIAENIPRSFAASAESLTFTMSGLSKISGLPQMKAAWLIASGPEELKAQALARLEVIADTFLSMNAPIQLATPSFLELRHGFQKQVMARVRKNFAELDKQLSAQSSCARLEVEGGWYAILRVPLIRSDEDLAIDLLNAQGVYVHPGHFYDFAADGYLIVSLITPEQDFKEGIKRLLSMF